MNLGDYRVGDTIDFHFTTRAFATGAPTQLAGSPAVAAYPNNSTTELTAGITLTVDFDSRTGLNHVRVVASSGNGYAAGQYSLVITAGTVGGTSVVGEVVGRFTLEATSAPTEAAIADKILGRSIAGSADGGRTVRQALRSLRNRVRIADGTMTVYEEDDSTPDYTAAVTTAAGNPIVETDPA